jgi:hypothetical protein
MIAVLSLFTFASAGWSLPSIDFAILEPTAGDVRYFGGATPLIGAGISVDFVIGTDTPSNPGGYLCIECTLNFVTGNFLGATANSWLFAGATGTSLITISGSVDTDGDLSPDIGPSILLAGTFMGPVVSIDFLPGSALAFGLTSGAFLDFKNPELAAFFGLPPSPFEGDLLLSWSGLAEPGSAILANPLNGLISNTFVPEPGTVLLLGLGFVLASFRRSKL